MKRRAVILMKGTKYNICCDVDFLPELMGYLMTDEQHYKELKLIFHNLIEGLNSKKYSNEDYGTKALKPFLNRENDRILCNVTKRKFATQCIVMCELYRHKKTNKVNKVLRKRYEIISKYRYEIVEGI